MVMEMKNNSILHTFIKSTLKKNISFQFTERRLEVEDSFDKAPHVLANWFMDIDPLAWFELEKIRTEVK